ncbi:MAG: hypothetical protein KGJ78_01665 [Alphaproteobacteria bacterium]|nr:hypothetical protein [Alphaproteobacteria bacterium]
MRHRTVLAVLAVLGALAGCAQPVSYFQASATGDGTQCEAENGSLRFIATSADGRRHVSVRIAALPGVPPTLLVIVDKNFKTVADKATDAALNAWWSDRSRPLAFSSDKIEVTWDDGALSQKIKGVMPADKAFAAAQSSNLNDYVFTTEFPLTGFDEDSLDVRLPAVTLDGITVAPPPVHFTRSDRTIMTPSDC